VRIIAGSSLKWFLCFILIDVRCFCVPLGCLCRPVAQITVFRKVPGSLFSIRRVAELYSRDLAELTGLLCKLPSLGYNIF
jgi:hypothetical protein